MGKGVTKTGLGFYGARSTEAGQEVSWVKQGSSTWYLAHLPTLDSSAVPYLIFWKAAAIAEHPTQQGGRCISKYQAKTSIVPQHNPGSVGIMSKIQKPMGRRRPSMKQSYAKS